MESAQQQKKIYRATFSRTNVRLYIILLAHHLFLNIDSFFLQDGKFSLGSLIGRLELVFYGFYALLDASFLSLFRRPFKGERGGGSDLHRMFFSALT